MHSAAPTATASPMSTAEAHAASHAMSAAASHASVPATATATAATGESGRCERERRRESACDDGAK